jgi:hypothetical protein
LSGRHFTHRITACQGITQTKIPMFYLSTSVRQTAKPLGLCL